MMKKPVPDPPRNKPPLSPFFTVRTDMYPPDALIHITELLRGVSQVIDEHCRNHTDQPGMSMLANAAHATDIARALSEHVLGTLDMAKLRGEA